MHNMMFLGGGMFIFWLLLLAVIVVAVGGLGGIRNRNRQEPKADFQQPMPKSPQDILRERYARGEINQEEYQQMQATLEL
jgi:putative membrane protein